MSAAATVQPTRFIRAYVTPQVASTPKIAPRIVYTETGLTKIAQHMFSLMLRNLASDGFSFVDPNPLDQPPLSLPGCIIAAPSAPVNTAGINQDYVYNWTRDAAIAAMEFAAAQIPVAPNTGVQPLIDYVNFAQICQNNATPSLALASYTIRGASRVWSEQTDGPALQTLAILMAWDQLDAPTQATATTVINNNVNYLIGAYPNQTVNLWEEHSGWSFFARSVQLRCFQAIQANTVGIPVPAGTGAAITALQTKLQQHWNGTYYASILPQPAGYDPNIDIVLACLYGAIPCTDTKLLATAAQLRSQWEDPNSPIYYPINVTDKNSQGIGPLLGRYPGDVYDGDTSDPSAGDHPWALSTCIFAELYYTLANQVQQTQTVPLDQLSTPFFSQIGVTAASPVASVVSALQAAGDAMLSAVIYHSDDLELSEQFDGVTGYEKSVKNLTWSYAAFLSAVRARTGQNVEG
jgi:glucoamylase